MKYFPSLLYFSILFFAYSRFACKMFLHRKNIVNCPLSIIYRSNRAINTNLSNSRTSTINCQLQSTKLRTTILPNSTPPIATAKNRKLHYKSSHTQKIQKTPSPSHKFRFIVLTHEMDNGQWIMDNEGIY